MRLISKSNNKLKHNRLLRRGELTYNIGSLVFGAGIALLAVGIAIAKPFLNIPATYF